MSPTQKAFRLINESRAYCVALANVYHAEILESDGRKAIRSTVRTIVKELTNEDKLPEKIAMASLCSSQFRHGKWRLIPEAERGLSTYYKYRQDERDNPDMMNPDEREDQDKKAEQAVQFGRHAPKNIMAEKRRMTEVMLSLINDSEDFCTRLRNAAGVAKQDKHVFEKEVHLILGELKPRPLYRNSLSLKLWRHGKWKDYAHESEAKECPTFIGWDFARKDSDGNISVGYLKPPSHGWKSRLPNGKYAELGTRIHDEFIVSPEQYDFANKELKAATKRMAEGEAAAKEEELSKLLKEYLAQQIPHSFLDRFRGHGGDSHETAMAFDAAEVEKRMLALPRRGLHFNMYNDPTRNHSLYPTNKEEFKMKIKTQTLINGVVLDSMTDDNLVTCITDVERKIATLEKVDTKSEYITKQIAGYRENAKQLAGFLDARGS
jgi:hypothetical protein